MSSKITALLVISLLIGGVATDGALRFARPALASGAHGVVATDTVSGINSPSSAAVALNNEPIAANYFGMTIESFNYNWGSRGGPLETWPTIPFSIARSWNVWSPGNGQIEYLSWAELNPDPGVYNFKALDSWIASCKANHTQMVYTFGYPPAWAGGKTPTAAAFQQFVAAIVEHSAGAIQYWEGFNEYNASMKVTAAQMVALQKTLYETVKALDPRASVLSPTVSDPSERTFAQFLAAGGGAYFDVAAFHGYNNSTGEGVIKPVVNVKKALNDAGLGNKLIWDTEWGMAAPTQITDPARQKAFLSINLVLQWALGVRTQILYAYDGADSAIYNVHTGELTAAGVVYQEVGRWLTNATQPSGYQRNGFVYAVRLNGQTDTIVWNSAGQSSYSAAPYTEYVDVQGEVRTIVKGTVTIDKIPILLQNPH